MNLFETFQKYKKGTFRKLNESFVRKTKKMASSSVTDEADSMIVSIELPIAELIRKRCPIHPKMLRYNEEKERMEYEYKNDYISYSRYEMLKKSLRKVQNTLNNHLELL